MEGLTTIRAFNAEENLKDEFDRHQDLYSSAFLTQRMAAHGFSFYMDMMSSILVIVVITRFLFFEHGKLKAIMRVFLSYDFVHQVLQPVMLDWL